MDPRAPYLAPLLLLVVCRMFMATRVSFAAEDAFITFRYAWNWVHGLGPVYNPGEHVLGFTSAPWMAWIALGLKLGAEPVAWARGTLVAADAVTLLALASLLERHASRTAAWCFALFFALWPYWNGLAATGLESGALLAWLALSAWLIDRRHPLAGVALGMLAIFRPEGLLAAVAIALWASWRERAIAAVIIVLAALALALTYGSPIPQSVLAKAAIYGAPGPLHATAWWDWTFPAPLSFGLATTSEGSNFFLISILVTPAALAGARVLWGRRRTALAAVVAGAALVWLAELLVGTSYFFWYFALPLLAWVLLACVGLPHIVKSRLVYAAALLAVAGHWTYETQLYAGRAFVEGTAFGAIGDAIAARAGPGETILLEPIGTIGWKCPNQRVLDEVGLVSPEVSKRRAQGAGWYTDLVAAHRPEWLVLRAGTVRRGASFVGSTAPFRDDAERAAVLAGYDVVNRLDAASNDQALVLMRRKPGR